MVISNILGISLYGFLEDLLGLQYLLILVSVVLVQLHIMFAISCNRNKRQFNFKSSFYKHVIGLCVATITYRSFYSKLGLILDY